MTGQPGAHTNRPELVAVHGYDTKYAMHALRLGLQGIELLSTGRITLPVPNRTARTCAPSATASGRSTYAKWHCAGICCLRLFKEVFIYVFEDE
jgi:hypothetical protein